jgi:hypothetical protein
MRNQALLGPVLQSPTQGRDANTARAAPAVRQIHLTPSIDWRALRRISWARRTLRRSRSLIQTTLGRPPRRTAVFMQVCPIQS